jgi:hypothetical protein
VVDAFDQLERCRQIERERYNKELARLTKENETYRRCYMEQFYNDLEIEKCWAVVGNYNRQHLELHEALREYIRNQEWLYVEAERRKECWNLKTLTFEQKYG